MAWRVPVLRQHDVTETACQAVDDRHHLVPARHRQRPAGTEIVLDVDDDENVAFARLERGVHGAVLGPPAMRRSVSSASFSSEAAIVTL
jgi:hypothetical protein